MKIKAWGTRGSISINNTESRKYGGNSTCYEVISDYLPPYTKLIIDAGTGFVPCGTSYLPQLKNGLNYTVLLTHYHWDHILGLTISPPTFIDEIPLHVYGPVDQERGLKEVLDQLFQLPFFPVECSHIEHHIDIHSMHDFSERTLIVHPKLGFKNSTRVEVDAADAGDKIVRSKDREIPLQESLVIKMAPTTHGNSTCIAYRFEERPTGKVFVFCTDHDNMRGIPKSLGELFKGANLAIVDAQYDEEKYINHRSHYGHGTPLGAVQLCLAGDVEKLGLTHHDPMVTDDYLESQILTEAFEALDKISADSEFLDLLGATKVVLKRENIFLCADYEMYEV